MIVCYNLYESEKGKIYMFLCDPDKLYELIPEYGGYAHGNIKTLGNITENNIKGRYLEYSLRPALKNNASKQKKLWDIMIKNFIVNENEINVAFANI